MDSTEQHFLYPSALFASRTPHRVVTVLGSCVAVCLWDPVLCIGGINHFMLPFWNGNGLASPKYGNIAIEKLIERMLVLGSSKSNLRAKIFGGGEVIEFNTANFHIGERNIAIAKEVLHSHGIPIVAQSLGGKNGRKLVFLTSTGEVFQKIIEKIQP